MSLWLNGQLVEDAAARIAPDDRGFTLGDGLFETIAVADGQPERLDRHLARLRDGARILGIPVTLDDAGLAAAMTELLAAKGLWNAVIRLTLTRGPAPRGVLPPASPKPTLLMTAAPRPAASPPAKVIIATVTRRNEFSPLSRIKSLNYLDNVLARREAAERDADDAILLNTAGRVAETTIANLFVVSRGTVTTPPTSDGALPGTRRAAILEQGQAVERPLDMAALMAADEVILSNSLGLRVVTHIDGRPVGTGQPGPIGALLSFSKSPP